MKKFVKMSLVAALAVAGTTASAQPLAEAIQNVDVSGTVVYRYDDKAIDQIGANDDQTNNYKVGVSLSSKVNEDVKFGSRFVVGSSTSSFASLNTSTTADANVNVALSTANFTYSGIANTTVTVGKQGLATPWTNAIDSDGSEQTGTGILAATTVGPVTLAAGYFNQHNIVPSAFDVTTTTSTFDNNAGSTYTNTTGVAIAGTDTLISTSSSTTNVFNGSNILVAGAMAKLGMVNAEAWYLDFNDIADSVYVGANTSFDVDAVKIGLDAKYTTMDVDGLNADLGNYEVGITAKMGIFNAGVAYAETDTDGSGILNALAKNGQTGYSVDIAGTDNAEMMTYYASAQITPELNVMVRYDDIEDQDAGAADDHSELWTQITYNMSKNLSTYVRFADGEDANVDYKRGRLQVEYKF